MSETAPAGRAAHWLAWALIASLTLLVASLHVRTDGTFTIDAVEVAEGTAVIEDCIADGVLSDCEERSGGRVGPFAPLKYIPAMALRLAGATEPGILAGMIVLNGVLFAALLALLAVAGVRAGGRSAAAALVLVAVTGPLLWYAHTAYGEVEATIAAELLVVSLWFRWHPGVAGLALFATVASKETAAPVGLALATVAVFWRPGERRLGRGEAAWLGAGLVAGLALVGGFNLFRYDELRNREYLRPEFRIPGLGHKLEYFAAQFVAPNGGLVWFWPSACALLVVSARRAVRPALAGLAILCFLAAGLASWWAPFGWDGWGPRLLLPWVLPALTPAALAAAPAIAGLLERVARRGPALVLAAVAIAAAGLPHLTVLVDSSRFRHSYEREWYLPTELAMSLFDRWPCPRIVTSEAVRDRYLPCLHDYVWERNLIIPRAYARAFGDAHWRYTLLLVGATGALLWLAAAPRPGPARRGKPAAAAA